eukprot:3342908-Pleurochrysis_carterae.AAC.1
MLPVSAQTGTQLPLPATTLSSDAHNQQLNTIIQLLLAQQQQANATPPCPPPPSEQPSFERDAHSDRHARTFEHAHPGEHAHLLPSLHSEFSP